MAHHSYSISTTQILSQTEISTVLDDLHHRATHSKSALVNLVIFRLATFCGLRVSELGGLQMDDVFLNVERPYINVPASVAKFHKKRIVPIWSTETITDLRAWAAYRSTLGIDTTAPFVCSVQIDTLGHPISRQNARKQFKNAVKSLGKERQRTLTIHDGRHTMCSLALHRNIPIAMVRDALGHSSISVTNIYTCIFDDGTSAKPSLDCA